MQYLSDALYRYYKQSTKEPTRVQRPVKKRLAIPLVTLYNRIISNQQRIKTMSKFKLEWIEDAMKHGKMTRAEAEYCWNQQDYRDQ